jgi:hypothetical protein
MSINTCAFNCHLRGFGGLGYKDGDSTPGDCLCGAKPSLGSAPYTPVADSECKYGTPYTWGSNTYASTCTP